MGCFSYLCNDCGHPINSDSYSGEHCILMVVEDGEVLEWMQGQYNSYGRVFMDGLADSYEWTVKDWSDIVNMHFGMNSDGISAYHSKCFDGDMSNESDSENDPEQGWGKYRFPTEGSAAHGLKVKAQPVWTKAEEE